MLITLVFFIVALSGSAQHTPEEAAEASTLQPGMRVLSTGKHVIVFEEGPPYPIAKPVTGLSLDKPTSKTAIEARPGVWAEPEIVATIDRLKAMTTEEVMESLSRNQQLFGFRRIGGSYPFEPHTVPPSPLQGATLIYLVTTDLRFDRLLKDFQQMPPDAAAVLLENALGEAVKIRKDYFELVSTRMRAAIDAQGTDALGAARVRKEVSETLHANPLYAAHPGNNLAYGMLLLLAAHLRAEPIHAYLLEVADEARAHRETIYGITTDPELLNILLYNSLYNRQCLLTALLGTSQRGAEVAQRLVADGTALREYKTKPYDAYNPYETGMRAAESGPGIHYSVYQAVSDENFDIACSALRGD